jgi:TonB family protein
MNTARSLRCYELPVETKKGFWRQHVVYLCSVAGHVFIGCAVFGYVWQKNIQTELPVIDLSVRFIDAGKAVQSINQKANPAASSINVYKNAKATESPASTALSTQAMHSSSKTSQQESSSRIMTDAVGGNGNSAARFDADYLKNSKPIYPESSRRKGEEGSVILRVQVDEKGLPLQVTLKKSSGYVRLDDSASMAVGRWRFVPAYVNGTAVVSWVTVPLTFRLKN